MEQPLKEKVTLTDKGAIIRFGGTEACKPPQQFKGFDGWTILLFEDMDGKIAVVEIF